jgi:outer membrane receptor for ferrienterochelin and colicins
VPKNIFWSTIFLAWLPLAVAGQTKVLSGHVIERGTGMAIPGATLQAGEQRTVTAANGSFSLAWQQGDSLRVSCTGFAPMALLPDVDAGNLHIILSVAAHLLEDVVVSGTLKPVRRAESAIPVESYSPAFFRQNPMPSVFDAVSMMNGVQSQLTCNVCNTGYLRINGMKGPYTMVLIDGMPIVSSLSTVYGLSGIPTSIIKRLEVVKGPASTLYGS